MLIDPVGQKTSPHLVTQRAESVPYYMRYRSDKLQNKLISVINVWSTVCFVENSLSCKTDFLGSEPH